jgi:hypothetical protein
MAFVGITLCGLCGARTEVFLGRMTVVGFAHKVGGKGYNAYDAKTVRSWKLCRDCFRKLSGVQTAGDRIIKEIELMLDKVKVEQNTPELIGELKG